ncbi:hypothetical protein [Flavobacterium poyangense]|uniref:hypothetical protein n=1 Tax=Flavobacterium poyangense TaxID=2204302 RepID=UPI0014247144|nr:hypothetical protein [Flavobacterium sp. JXAS1]
MKRLKNRLQFVLFFCIVLPASAQYVETYEPINVFLETLKLDKKRKYVLQADKEPNIIALDIFNGGEGPDPLREMNVPLDYREGLFVEKHWREMYNSYINDTVKKYWKKEDFPEYNFILEKGRGLVLRSTFLDKYLNSEVDSVILISEPMFYMDRKYIMFSFNIFPFFGSSQSKVVIMKKEKGKWIVVSNRG